MAPTIELLVTIPAGTRQKLFLCLASNRLGVFATILVSAPTVTSVNSVEITC
jgi:hypothetical protein